MLIEQAKETFEEALKQAENHLLHRNLVALGDRILIRSGILKKQTDGANFLKLHTVWQASLLKGEP